MKIVTALCLLLPLALASVSPAGDAASVAQFLQSHDEGLSALFFFDSSADDEQGILEALTDAIVGDSDDKDVANMLAISNEVETLGVDLAKAQFKDLAENYEVKEAPYLIVFDDGVASIKEIPTESTVQKVQAFKRIQAVNDTQKPKEIKSTEDAQHPQDENQEKPVSPMEQIEHDTEEESTVEPVKIDRNDPNAQP